MTLSLPKMGCVTLLKLKCVGFVHFTDELFALLHQYVVVNDVSRDIFSRGKSDEHFCLMMSKYVKLTLDHHVCVQKFTCSVLCSCPFSDKSVVESVVDFFQDVVSFKVWSFFFLGSFFFFTPCAVFSHRSTHRHQLILKFC